QNLSRHRRLIWSLLAFSILILAECYRIFLINGLTKISNILYTNYLVTGQTLGVGLLVLIPYSYFIFNTKKIENKGIFNDISSINWLWTLFVSSLFFYALINLGGRGPILATTGAVILFYLVKCWQDSSAKPATHFGVLVLSCLLAYF